MAYFVKAKINGRNDFYRLVGWLESRGICNAEYYDGVEDGIQGIIEPHLKFEDEDEALIYILAMGGTLSKTVPMVGERHLRF